jgi:hypothetical protein
MSQIHTEWNLDRNIDPSQEFKVSTMKLVNSNTTFYVIAKKNDELLCSHIHENKEKLFEHLHNCPENLCPSCSIQNNNISGKTSLIQGKESKQESKQETCLKCERILCEYVYAKGGCKRANPMHRISICHDDCVHCSFENCVCKYLWPDFGMQGGYGANPNLCISCKHEYTHTKKTKRERCKFGEKCYRKSPYHKEEFSHPGDLDY